jgi:hypothetical protein
MVIPPIAHCGLQIQAIERRGAAYCKLGECAAGPRRPSTQICRCACAFADGIAQFVSHGDEDFIRIAHILPVITLTQICL